MVQKHLGEKAEILTVDLAQQMLSSDRMKLGFHSILYFSGRRFHILILCRLGISRRRVDVASYI